MKFTAELTIPAQTGPGDLDPDAIIRFARAAEAAGFDAIAFNDHPAPSAKWLENGGHGSFDPFAALAFCAAVTSRIRLIPHLLVLPYRNPFLVAKSIATLDVLSKGRFVIAVGTGYLRSEFAALGVDFDERNEVFDESLRMLNTCWSDSARVDESRRWRGKGQISTPAPLQLPRPPVWIGGSSARSMQRAGTLAEGWSPLLLGAEIASTSRTGAIASIEELRHRIERVHDMRRDSGRTGPFEVQLQCEESFHAGSEDVTTARHLEALNELSAAGVTQFVVNYDVRRILSTRIGETLQIYGDNVIALATPSV